MAEYVFIDDDDAGFPIAEFRRAGLNNSEVHAPDDLTKETLRHTRVVMVDWSLHERTADLLVTQPTNGFDVATLLGSWTELLQPNACVAICLYSARLEDLKGGYPPGLYRQHAIARRRELEWVFERATDLDAITTQAAQLKELRAGVDKMRELGAQHESFSRDMLRNILELEAGAPEQVWTEIEESRPPTHESWKASNGRSVLRWLLHRILPYPTFLIDENQVAARCRLSIRAFRTAMEASRPLQALYDEGQYRGIFSRFIGTRWWTHRINQKLWDLTKGRSFDPDALREALQAPQVATDEVVLCIDGEYKWESELTPIGSAVRVAPEDWPVFAQDAWMAIARIRDAPDLVDLVQESDRELLPNAKI